MLYNNWVIQNFRLPTNFDYVNIIFFRNVVIPDANSNLLALISVQRELDAAIT